MEHFDVIVLGGGPGGYLAAERAAQAGFATALIEQKELGGTCLNEGCVPTKSLLFCAKQYAHALHGTDFGTTVEGAFYSHEAALKRKDQVVKRLVRGVAASMKANGVCVFQAVGTLRGKSDTGEFLVAAGDKSLTASRIILATGSNAVVPPIPGVREGLEAGFVLTNREILALHDAPKTLCCIGGGVIGLEMACYFASIGTKVIVVEMMPKIAGATDPEICALLMKTYQKNGMEFHLNARVQSVTEQSVIYEDADGVHEIPCDKVLLSAGRRANTAGCGLETLGIRTERGAICTDEHMMTNVPNVYAVGDCNGKLMLAHTAYREAEVAVGCLRGIPDRMDYTCVPSVIYTTPEVASVGLSEEEAKKSGHEIKAVKVPMLFSGRYVAENVRGEGFCKLVYDVTADRLLGVQMVGSYASEIIYGAGMMVQLALPLEQLKKIVFPHPSVCEVLREGLFML